MSLGEVLSTCSLYEQQKYYFNEIKNTISYTINFVTVTLDENLYCWSTKAQFFKILFDTLAGVSKRF